LRRDMRDAESGQIKCVDKDLGNNLERRDPTADVGATEAGIKRSAQMSP